MTADASVVIIDTSRGQKNTDQVLEEHANKEVVTRHETLVTNRAQAALNLRTKIMKEAKQTAEDGQEREAETSEIDDLLGDEDDEALVCGH